MSPEQQFQQVSGATLCWYEWGREFAAAGTILLVHATGFHARSWDQVVRYLGQRHVIAIDQRGHGLSSNDGPFSWDQFGADLTEFLVAVKLRQVIGVGHSMGGHALVQAAANLPSVFTRLVLIDPVIMSPETYTTDSVHLAWMNEGGEHPVARRKNRFESPVAFEDNLRGRGSYSLWQPECLTDYCQFGVVPFEDGVQLACPPAVEAAIYLGSAQSPVFAAVRQIEVPVTLLRARLPEPERRQMDFSSSPTWVSLAEEFQDAEDVPLLGLTHFIPMQAPELTAQYIIDKR